MATKYGVGIENEFTVNFANNPMSKQKNYATSFGDLSMPEYHHTSGKWSRQSGWRQSGSGQVVFEGDPTVRGTSGSGIEFGTDETQSVNVKPKQLVDDMMKAQNALLPKSRTSSDSFNRRYKAVFGSNVGEDNVDNTGKGFGSFHLNLTFPYDDEKIESNETYRHKYYDKTIKGVKSVRLLQPLIVGMTGGVDAKAIGNPSYGEGSGRQLYNSYANLGNVSLGEKFEKAIRRGVERPGSTMFKYQNQPPKYRNVRATERISLRAVNSSENNVYTSEVGDIGLKQYRNVSGQVRTVEFRFFDNFRTKELYPLTKIIIAAMENGDRVEDFVDPREEDAWNVAAVKALEEGWNAQLPKDYIVLINKRLSINVPVPAQSMRLDKVFYAVSDELWMKNKDGEWVKTMFDEYSVPEVNNMNRDNWDAQFRYKYLNDSRFKDYVDKILATILKVDASASGGWIAVRWSTKGFAIRDIILDDDTYGLDFGTEDFEDALFMLQRLGKIELREDATGRISSVKVLYPSVDDVGSAIKTMPITRDEYGNVIVENNAMYIHGTAQEVPSEVEPGETVTFRPAPTPSPRVVEPQRGAERIGEWSITSPTVTVSEDESLVRSDVQDVFNRANFLSASGAPYRVTVEYASIKHGSNPKMFAWRKSGNSITVYMSLAERMRIDYGNLTVSQIISEMRSYGFHNVDGSWAQSEAFTSNMTATEFFARLKNTATEVYSKDHAQRQSREMKLDRAGFTRLKAMGINIGSVDNGQKYVLFNKAQYASMQKTYGSRLRVLHSVPYWKDMWVQYHNNAWVLQSKSKTHNQLRWKP